VNQTQLGERKVKRGEERRYVRASEVNWGRSASREGGREGGDRGKRRLAQPTNAMEKKRRISFEISGKSKN